MRGPDCAPGNAQARLSLDLLEGISGKLVKSTQTSDAGEFRFEGVAPGIYLLNLKPSGLRAWSGEEITGAMAVTVDQSAPEDHLDVDFGWTSCGFSYGDRSRCS